MQEAYLTLSLECIKILHIEFCASFPHGMLKQFSNPRSWNFWAFWENGMLSKVPNTHAPYFTDFQTET